ncbi:IGR protein motif-domain-containing protein [Bisporella sp. PMI_857]|nr:IGR protein motif-domain-containing protein [Bisporella sp. PMI_857]
MFSSIIKPVSRPIPSFLLPFRKSSSASQARSLTQALSRQKAPRPPRTTPFVPDVKTFLTLIGRSLSKHSDKITSWRDLFTLTSGQLKGLGIEPARDRRYLLRWREKFRAGLFGIGGDLKYVDNGRAELRVVKLWRSKNRNVRKQVVNVPSSISAQGKPKEHLPIPTGFHIKGAKTIIGKAVQPLKGKMGAKLVVSEGLWEDKRGRVIDGGERRRVRIFREWHSSIHRMIHGLVSRVGATWSPWIMLQVRFPIL